MSAALIKAAIDCAKVRDTQDVAVAVVLADLANSDGLVEIDAGALAEKTRLSVAWLEAALNSLEHYGVLGWHRAAKEGSVGTTLFIQLDLATLGVPRG